jgi:hypothetical protein
MVFLVSTCVRQARTATILGFGIFLIGSIMQAFATVIFADSTPQGYRILFSFFPFTLLAQGMSQLGDKSNTEASDGMRWSERTDNTDGWSMQANYNWFIVDFFFYMFWALYFDQVIENENGIRQSPCFCVMPSYWCKKKRVPAGAKLVKAKNGDIQMVTSPSGNEKKVVAHGSDAKETDEVRLKRGLSQALAGEDVDVMDETARVETLTDDEAPVRIVKLGKVFRATNWCCQHDPKRDFHAVRGISLALDRNKLFCLLGMTSSPHSFRCADH